MVKENFTRRAFVGTALAGAAICTVSNPLAAFAVTSAEKQAEANAVAEKLNGWQAQLDAASDNYFAALEAHDSAVAKMNDAQARIIAAEAKIVQLQDHLGSRANAMYKQGSGSFVEVLLGATSFSDFASTWDFLNGLNQSDADAVEETKVLKAEAQAAHDEYVLQEKIAADKLAEAEAIKAEAESLVAQYQAELNGLEAEVAALVAQEQEAARAAEAARVAAEANYGSSGDDYSSGGDTYVGYNPGTGNAIVDAAYTQLGVPYVWGGTTPYGGLDCSGLTQYCYRCAGISIPRTSSSQYAGAPMRLSLSDAQPGDILWKSGHVGICIEAGGGTYIAAPQTGDVVRIQTYQQFTCALRYT